MKAAFLYSFVKFTQWPEGSLALDAPLVLCVIGDREVSEVLAFVSEGRLIAGHPLDVRSLRFDEPIGACHLAYLSDSLSRRTRLLLGALAGRQVLTIGDGESFVRSGGLIGFIEDGGQMKFAINPAAAQRAGLRISAQLLKMSKVVGEEPRR